MIDEQMPPEAQATKTVLGDYFESSLSLITKERNST